MRTLPHVAARAAIAAFLLALCLLPAPLARAGSELRLPKIFASHMVLQRDMPIPVWGWAAPGESVALTLGTSRATATATAAGEWKAALPALGAGGPYKLTVSAPASGTVTFDDVLIGEVWLCSGQSNMEMGISLCRDAQTAIAAADHPRIRLFMVPNRFSTERETDIEPTGTGDGSWKVCTPASIAEGGSRGFSAAAYFFGRDIEKALDVPVGLIDATWGGTVIQTWTPPEGFAEVPALKDEYRRVLLADRTSDLHREALAKAIDDAERWTAAARKAIAAHTPEPPMPTFPDELLPLRTVQDATALYNGMISPICPYGVRGAIWYQGESNLGDGPRYTARMQALISGWRTLWGVGDFPFYFVQIAPFNYGGDPQVGAAFWAAQSAAQSIPNTGMVVTNDIGDFGDIHPTNKEDVGARLARLALARTYGKEVVCSGPTLKSARADGARLRVTFDNIGAGLVSRDGKPLTAFELLDADDGQFVAATAKIDGASVVLSSPEVRKPVAMRFAWTLLSQPNLANSAGLPAGQFQWGDVPVRDVLLNEVREAKDYTVVLDLDLGELGTDVTYDVDDRAKFTRKMERIAYCLELTDGKGDQRFVYASMDAFTDDLAKIGVPTLQSGAFFQTNVTKLNVVSNVKGITTGTGLKGGNVEFWPSNYGAENSANVPSASASTWDFGDSPAQRSEGYGSMQIHNHDAKQTLFALNHWSTGAGADLGIGNQPTGNPDWTFAANAGSFTAKRLRVLVR